MRTPQRFEKHGKHWYIMGVEPFTVNGETSWAWGPYANKQEAEDDFRGVCKTMRREHPDYEREISPCPSDYIPREEKRVIAREAKRWRKRSVARETKRHRRESGETSEPTAEQSVVLPIDDSGREDGDKLDPYIVESDCSGPGFCGSWSCHDCATCTTCI